MLGVRSRNVHETRYMYSASDQVIVLILYLLYIFSSKENPFVNVITREHLTLLASFSGIVVQIQKTSISCGILYQMARKHGIQRAYH